MQEDGPEQIIPDILAEHLDKAQFLWGQRTAAMRSSQSTFWDHCNLDARLAAHLDGLVIGGHHTVKLVAEALDSSKAENTFAAAMPLLAMEQESARRLVLEAFQKAKGGGLAGLCQAMCHGAIELFVADLQRFLGDAAEERFLAAAEALAFHRRLDGAGQAKVVRLLQHGRSEIRQQAWRIISLGEPRGDSSSYKLGIADPNPLARWQALEAALWGGQSWLLPQLRKLASRPQTHDFDVVYFLAVIGQNDDLPDMLRIGTSSVFGPGRFQILGAYGHPAVVETILAGIESKDPPTALAAGAAFAKITGADIDSKQRIALPPEDGHEPTDFEKEFLEEATLPSGERARAHWHKVQEACRQSTRWCRGQDMSKVLTPTGQEKLDLESLWEDALRRRFARVNGPSLRDLDRFPQRAADGVAT